MASTSTKITYRKTKSGRWVVQGPATIVRPRTTVIVQLKNGGTKTETIESVGKPFILDGVEMVYGYPARSTNRPTTRRRSRRYSGWDEDHEDCLSFGPCGPNCEYAHIYR